MDTFKITTICTVASVAFGTLLSGCSSIITKNAPTIAHVHIGHALTGWVDTPNKQGLLITADQEAAIATENSELLYVAANQGNLDSSQRSLNNLGHVLDPEQYSEGNGIGYGLRKATNGAISHLTFSADSQDVSENALRSIPKITQNAKNALDRCDELLALVEEALKIDDIEIIAELSKDIRSLSYDIVGGTSKITQNAYGLFELRADIDAMVNQEAPPYSTVDSFYLFNLIRLPDGSWKFPEGGKQESSDSSY